MVIGAFRRMTMALALALLPALPAGAEGASSAAIAFGGLKGDPSQPVTVTSQTLTMTEETRSAVFAGDVLVVQGEMRLTAREVRVEYDTAGTRIEKLWATGDVLLVNASDAAQAQSAEYVIDDGLVTMLGDVVLTQGAATFSAARLIADLTTGLGRLEGGVTTSFAPSATAGAAP